MGIGLCDANSNFACLMENSRQSHAHRHNCSRCNTIETVNSFRYWELSFQMRLDLEPEQHSLVDTLEVENKLARQINYH